MNNIWRKEDPRYHINKRALIVVIYTCFNGYQQQAVIADVETKNGWSIKFNKTDRPIDSISYISADENWPGWFWTFLPIEADK